MNNKYKSKIIPSTSSEVSITQYCLKELKSGIYLNLDGRGWLRPSNSIITNYMFINEGYGYQILVSSGDYTGYYLSKSRDCYIGAYKTKYYTGPWSKDPVDFLPDLGLYIYYYSGPFGDAGNYVCCDGKNYRPNGVITVQAVATWPVDG